MTKHVLTVSGRTDEIRTICRFVVEGARKAGLDEDTIFHIDLSCDEAATNIIEHAYEGDVADPITVQYEVTDEAFTITMVDHGRPFHPDSIPAPPGVDQEGELSPDEFEVQLVPGGLGLHFIRSLMDKVDFTFSEDDGNTLVMVKRLS